MLLLGHYMARSQGFALFSITSKVYFELICWTACDRAADIKVWVLLPIKSAWLTRQAHSSVQIGASPQPRAAMLWVAELGMRGLLQ